MKRYASLLLVLSYTLPSLAGAATSNAFNPDIALILSGTYGQFQHDPATYAIPGFPGPADNGPGGRGFSIGESELALSANIDPDWYGMLTLAMAGDNTTSVENAFVQTTSLGNGVTLRGGRFFSGIGYLNEQHAHTWDFVDTALPYRALLGTQYKDDGVQIRWVAPTNLFNELGTEWMNGSNFPAGGSANNGRGAWSVFYHLGDDVGDSHSWRAGISWLATKSIDRQTPSANPADLDRFTGTSKLLVADFVWKWAPLGNATQRNFKLQAEYLHIKNDGEFIPALATAIPYDGKNNGWYVQGVYQFMPRWRIGLRHDQLKANDPGSAFAGTVLATQGHTPSRNSIMMDYSNSEFSRLRLQYNRDDSARVAENQWFLQYQMSLGAHGAHQF